MLSRHYPRIFLVVCLLEASLFGSVSFAQASRGYSPSELHDENGVVNVVVDPGGALALDAKSVSLARIFDTLSSTLGVPIQYVQVPDTEVSLACYGASLLDIMRCLLGTDSDLVFKYAGVPAKGRPHGDLISVKVLASTFERETDAGLEGAKKGPLLATVGSDTPAMTLEEVMGMTRSPVEKERLMGFGKLRELHGVNADVVLHAFLEGLTDRSGDVRAEAVMGLVKVEGVDVPRLLAESFLDKDVSVRLAALDVMKVDKDNVGLVDPLLNDPDDTVRELAAMRLKLTR